MCPAKSCVHPLSAQGPLHTDFWLLCHSWTQGHTIDINRDGHGTQAYAKNGRKPNFQWKHSWKRFHGITEMVLKYKMHHFRKSRWVLDFQFWNRLCVPIRKHQSFVNNKTHRRISAYISFCYTKWCSRVRQFSVSTQIGKELSWLLEDGDEREGFLLKLWSVMESFYVFNREINASHVSLYFLYKMCAFYTMNRRKAIFNYFE